MLRFVCSVGLALLSISVCSAAKVPESSIKWAERQLSEATDYISKDDVCGTQSLLRCAQDAFLDIQSKYGKQNGRVWAGLAKSQARLGEYDKAVKSYQKAIYLLPGHIRLKKELEEVQNQQSVAKAASKTLSKEEAVFQALPYPVLSEPNLWVVLSGEAKWGDHPSWPEISNCHLTVFNGKPDSLKRVWTSHILGHLESNEGLNDVYMFIKDVTGDGIPDVVVSEIIFGGSWAPSHIDIFTWCNDRLAHLLGASSDEPFMVKDFNRDGRYEVIGNHAVGRDLSHAGQPRWLSIYASKNGTYQLANADFPAQYHKLYKYIKSIIRDYPDDYELYFYWGWVNEIEGKPHTALKAYRRAEKNALEYLADAQKEADSSEWAPGVRYTLHQIRSRMTALKKHTVSGTCSRNTTKTGPRHLEPDPLCALRP